ncbi:MAG: hypothetical protein KGJ06_06210 [Pseudomonadota bacterium]|nr:hypothetical protein [Pseudomonadota bacterium]
MARRSLYPKDPGVKKWAEAVLHDPAFQSSEDRFKKMVEQTRKEEAQRNAEKKAGRRSR